MLKLIAAFALACAPVASSALCAPVDAAHKILAQAGQTEVFHGTVGAGAIEIWAAPRDGSFGLWLVSPSGAECLATAGSAFFVRLVPPNV